LEDESVITAVQELARLKKVYEYCSEILIALDPELVPRETWNQLNSATTNCRAQVEEFNAKKALTSLSNANNTADSFLTFLRPYLVGEVEAIKAVTSSSLESANTIEKRAQEFMETVSELLKNVQDFRKTAEGAAQSSTEAFAVIDGYLTKLTEGEGEDPSIIDLIQLLQESAQSNSEKILEYHDQLLTGDNEKPSIKQTIAQQVKEINNNAAATKSKLASITEETEDFESFHFDVFGDPEDEGKDVRSGKKYELQRLMQKMTKFEEAQSNKYEELNTAIESLIPGATTAGLASAYERMKSSFSWPNWGFTAVFYGAIGALFWIGWTSIVASENLEEVLKGLLIRLPLYGPIIWLAVFVSKRRSENQRLQQEYAHKEALAKSYASYKEQIENLQGEDKEMLSRFMDKIIDAIVFNASSTLDKDHRDPTPLEHAMKEALERARDTVGHQSS
jgi:hypothetical protein